MKNNLSNYAIRLSKLKIEFNEIETKLRKKKKKFNENQQKVYDFVIYKKDIIQFSINQEQFFIKKGNEYKGFMHILLRHYGEECEGKLTATNILNIATTIKMGTYYKSEKNDYMTISNNFNGTRYKIVFSKEINGNWIVSYYSVEE